MDRIKGTSGSLTGKPFIIGKHDEVSSGPNSIKNWENLHKFGSNLPQIMHEPGMSNPFG